MLNCVLFGKEDTCLSISIADAASLRFNIDLSCSHISISVSKEKPMRKKEWTGNNIEGENANDDTKAID